MQRMVLTTLWCLLLISWICGSQGQDGEPCSGFWEIGEPQSLSCSSKQLTDGITLQMKVNNGYVNVSSCKLSGRQCTDNMAPVYTTTFFGITENDGEKRNAMLVYINSTSKNESTFRCVYDGRPTNTACFEMFGTPAKPECDLPTLVNSDTQLNITCTSDRVYPDAYMSILALHGGQVYPPDDYEAEFHTSLSPSMTHVGYNFTTTQTLVDLSTLEPDTYQFLILMHPLISNITMAGGIMSEHTQIENVVLTAPVAILSSDCPVDSYIMAGNCTCNLTTPGYPPGQARWFTQTGQVVGSENSEDRTSTLSFSQQSAASYECRAETVLNVTSASTVSFTPKFPYGPHSVIIESSVVDGIFDLCPSEEYKTVVVTCKVPAEDVEPGVTLAILVNNDIPVDEQNGEKTDSHNIYHYSFRPSKGGSYSVECRAQNTVSLQPAYSEKLTFEVREPPPSPPVLHVPPNQPGSEEANIVLGRTLDITCKVDGGYRKVSEITITCGSRKQQVQSNIATLTVEDVTQSMDGQMCYCSATHDSGCYDKESEVLLKMVSADTEDNENQSSDTKLILVIALPVTCGVVVIALVVVNIMICTKKRKRNPDPPKNNDTGLQPMQRNALQGVYVPQRPQASSDYARVMRSDDVTSNRDWGHTNPRFTASHQYDRMSTGFGSTRTSDFF